MLEPPWITTLFSVKKRTVSCLAVQVAKESFIPPNGKKAIGRRPDVDADISAFSPMLKLASPPAAVRKDGGRVAERIGVNHLNAVIGGSAQDAGNPTKYLFL